MTDIKHDRQTVDGTKAEDVSRSMTDRATAGEQQATQREQKVSKPEGSIHGTGRERTEIDLLSTARAVNEAVSRNADPVKSDTGDMAGKFGNYPGAGTGSASNTPGSHPAPEQANETPGETNKGIVQTVGVAHPAGTSTMNPKRGNDMP